MAAAIFTLVALFAFATGAAVVVASRRAARNAASPARTVAVRCGSTALGGTLPALVYLPSGYANGSGRYRVVYFLHGLPAGPTSYEDNGFVASALAASGRSALVVVPQGARAGGSDREYLDWDAREDWPHAISHDLPNCIDKRFRTVATRFGRALIGVSAGGYGAFNIGLRELARFGAVESWSGYFAATDPAGDRVLDFGSTEANSNAQVPSGGGLEQEVRRWPALIAFYVGDQDARFLAMNQQFDAALNQSRVKHLFKVYPGAHTAALWSAHGPYWLGLAIDSLRSLAGQATRR